MPKLRKILFRCLLLGSICITASANTQWRPLNTEQTLWYDAPARQWEETVPLGNGRLGMMPDGGVRKEKVVLNEISMWSGSEADYSNPQAHKYLPEIQKLLIEGKNHEAQELMYKTFVPSKPEKGGTYGCYQMLADLDITYDLPESAPTDYHRWLDLRDAGAYTAFNIGGVEYLREYYVPRGSDMMVIHLTANKKDKINLSLSLQRKERASTVALSDSTLQLSGTLDSGKEGTDGISFCANLRVMTSGAKASCKADNSQLKVSDADEAWILIAADTSFEYTDRNKEYTDALEWLNTLDASDIAQTIHRGISNHRELYGRAGLNLAATEQSALPTTERIEAFAIDDNDPQLAALYYNYGRYLLISSTLPGLLPPNLQGLWANECGTPWNGDYHTNINVQMNHWPAEQGNLSELHLPLTDLVENAVHSGERTAKAFYGPDARGWVMHMMTNVWGYTEPGEHPSWGATNTGGAWLCAHLWEHHLYNPTDTAYLRRIYPVMKGASDFFLSTMITEPEHGWLVTAPSSSPENEFIQDGHKVSVVMGPTMDTQIVGELFGNVISASEELGVDKSYADSLRTAISQLPPMQAGKDGRLMEWLEEYTEADPHHRHVSHLYGLHPGNQISVANTPQLADAARLTLERRGDEGTGWSRAWKINFWSRLADGNRAYRLFHSLLSPAYTDTDTKHTSGTFPNLFCSHPPFQLDGNFGGSAGISEMLVQSQDGFINILPALPDAFADGSLYGFKARGGATVNLEWNNHRPTLLEIDSPVAQRVMLPAEVRNAIIDGKPTSVADGWIEVKAGKTRIEFDQ